MEPPGGAGPSQGGRPAGQLVLDLGATLRRMSPADIRRLALNLSTPNTLAEKQFASLLKMPGVCAAVLGALKAGPAMPDDAAERWGPMVAKHTCLKRDGNCLAKLAREAALQLDLLRARLVAAQQHALASKQLAAVVPLRMLKKLAHHEGSSSASDAQAGAAAASAADGEARKHESEESAAVAVRSALNQCGCCVKAEQAFLDGFVGRSNDFVFKKTQTGTRREGVDERRLLEHKPAPQELHDAVCCAQLCGARMSVADWGLARQSFVAAVGRPAQLHVVINFIWDAARGEVRPMCDERLSDLFGLGADEAAYCRRHALGARRRPAWTGAVAKGVG